LRILAHRELVELAGFEPAQWVEEFGVSLPTAERLVAAFTLARHLRRSRRKPRASMRSARRVFEEVDPRLRGKEQETFLVLLLDARHSLKRVVTVTEGTLTSSLVHPREVFRPAIREAAAAVIVVHNHPSGDAEPSREDYDVTRRLARAGKLLGIPLVDHVVVGDGTFVSIRSRMDLDAE
jgi:DNA repair protein RadC